MRSTLAATTVLATLLLCALAHLRPAAAAEFCDEPAVTELACPNRRTAANAR